MMYGLLLAQYLAHSIQRLVAVPCGPLDTSLWMVWTCGQGAGMGLGPHICRHCLGFFFVQDHEHCGAAHFGFGRISAACNLFLLFHIPHWLPLL